MEPEYQVLRLFAHISGSCIVAKKHAQTSLPEMVPAPASEGVIRQRQLKHQMKKPRISGAREVSREEESASFDICGLKALWSFDNIELNTFSFGKRFEALTNNGGKVHKNVFAAILLDKTKTFAVIEPFHPAVCHFDFLLFS